MYERMVRSARSAAIGTPDARLGPVLRLIAARAVALVRARGAIILLLEGDQLVVAASAGAVPQGLIGTRFDAAGSACDPALRSRRAVLLSDPAALLRLPLARAADAEAAVLVRLSHERRTMGVVAAFDRLGADPAFSPDDARLMEAFAASAAIAIATAREVTASILERTIDAAERERARWARELHDEALQELGAMLLTLHRAKRARDASVRRAAVDDSIDAAEHAILALREIISDLRPAALEAHGLQAALESLAERARARSGLLVELRTNLAVEPGRPASPRARALEAGIYRIVQEATTNALKHARASQVVVAVVEDDHGVVLSVEDDGRGFDADARPAVGLGLIGMRERVDLLGGALTVTSWPGAGTRIEALLPSQRRLVDPAADTVFDRGVSERALDAARARLVPSRQP